LAGFNRGEKGAKMTVWVLYGNATMLEIWDRQPSIRDLKDFADEMGWPAQCIDGWQIQKWSIRESTAL